MSKFTWDFRPVALTLYKNYYETLDRGDLFRHYLEDGNRAKKIEQMHGEAQDHKKQLAGQGGTIGIPDLPTFIPVSKNSGSSSSPSLHLRTCQWNIHSLSAHWEGTDDTTHTQNVAETILQTKPHVIVLNEYYSSNKLPLQMTLELGGYRLYRPFGESNVPFPTVIFTNLPVKNWGCFKLDMQRAAVYVEVQINHQKYENDESSSSSSPQFVTVFGTHLDDYDMDQGAQRLQEANVLLKQIESLNKNYDMEANPTLIIGDLNQQRGGDYYEEEWEAIVLNKLKRHSPLSDGVSFLLERAGFRSCFDSFCRPLEAQGKQNDMNGEELKEQHRQDELAGNNDTSSTNERPCKCNWNPKDPPPPTHWTSTVIDFAYARGGNEYGDAGDSKYEEKIVHASKSKSRFLSKMKIREDGVYVSPSTLSDHRMVVCDWNIHQD